MVIIRVFTHGIICKNLHSNPQPRITISMKKLLLTFLALPLTSFANPLQITDTWARATVGSQKTSAVYGTVINPTNAPIKIIGAKTPNAPRTQLHTHITKENGQMRMVQVPSITIPSQGQLILKPMGNHIMMMGIESPLITTNELPVTFLFEDGTEQTFRAEIKPINYRPNNSTKHEESHHHGHH